MKKCVAVFFGGLSSEHDISCLSAATVAGGLDRKLYDVLLVGITRGGKWLLAPSVESIRDGSWRDSGVSAQLLPARGEGLLIEGPEKSEKRKIDVAWPVLHGRFGEDGCIQGLFELAGIPYVGPGVTASGVCMDKLYTKQIVAQLGVDQARYVAFDKDALKDEKAAVAAVETELGYPVFVKPTDGGSSQGVSRVDSREGLLPALAVAAAEGSRVMVEEAIVGREIECAVLSLPEGAKASGVGEVLAAAQFYDFEAKYSNPDSETDLHPHFPEGKEEEVQRKAEAIFRAVGCYGMTRVDFFLEKGTDRVIFNEANTLPGFTSISMYPKLWEAAGLPLPALLDKLIEAAERRGTQKVGQ